MIKRLRVTALADNWVAAPDLVAGHGLSMLIEADDRRILFDTGQGKVLLANADALGVSLSPLDAMPLHRYGRAFVSARSLPLAGAGCGGWHRTGLVNDEACRFASAEAPAFCRTAGTRRPEAGFNTRRTGWPRHVQ